MYAHCFAMGSSSRRCSGCGPPSPPRTSAYRPGRSAPESRRRAATGRTGPAPRADRTCAGNGSGGTNSGRRSVPATLPGCEVRRGEERIGLGSGQERHRPLREALLGNGEHLLDGLGLLGMAQRGVRKKERIAPSRALRVLDMFRRSTSSVTPRRGVGQDIRFSGAGSRSMLTWRQESSLRSSGPEPGALAAELLHGRHHAMQMPGRDAYTCWSRQEQAAAPPGLGGWDRRASSTEFGPSKTPWW